MKQKPKRHHGVRLLVSLLTVLLLSNWTSRVANAQPLPPTISVQPVFVVPRGQRRPKNSDQRLLMKHLQWTQQRYREMLGNRSTFELEDKPLIFNSKRTIKQFEVDGNAANLLVSELLDEFQTTRFTCQHIFVAIFVNAEKNFPRGGGRPFNGGYNTGGGIVVASTHALRSSNFQSTLQHELGHSFGLPHVTSYGYSKQRNASVMSYNPSHLTSHFSPSKTPGILIPEDIRGLSVNDRVFKNLEFDADEDVPKDYELKAFGHLTAMEIPGHPLIQVETPDGEQHRSSVRNIVHSRILRSVRGKNEYHDNSMWHSAKQKDGVASVYLTFPKPTTLNRIGIYSQHSGKAHWVDGVIISTVDADGKTTVFANATIDRADAEVTFKQATSKRWKLDFVAGKSQFVVLRGLRFFDGEQELYAPLVPYEFER